MTKSETRDQKIENLIMNHTMIFMAMFEEAFTTIAEQMTTAMAAGASALAEALGGRPSDSSEILKKTKEEIAPEIKTNIAKAFSGIRSEIASQWPKDDESLKKYLSDPAFDRAIFIVERHEFNLPRLTEKLDDGVLASYVVLLKNGDEDITAMLKELSDLMNALPRPPWATIE